MHIIREISPNGLPLVVDALYSHKGVVPESVRVFPILGCPDKEAVFIGEQLPWKARKLAIRLNTLLKQSNDITQENVS